MTYMVQFIHTLTSHEVDEACPFTMSCPLVGMCNFIYHFIIVYYYYCLSIFIYLFSIQNLLEKQTYMKKFTQICEHFFSCLYEITYCKEAPRFTKKAMVLLNEIGN